MCLIRPRTTKTEKAQLQTPIPVLRGEKQVARSTNDKHVQEKYTHSNTSELALYVPTG